MWHKNRILLSLAGLTAGISLLYNSCPPLIVLSVLLFSLLLALRNKRMRFFTIFLIAGIFTAYIHIHITEGDITTIGEKIYAAEGKILSARPGAFSTSYTVRIYNVLTENGERLETAGKVLLKTKHRRDFYLTPGMHITMSGLELKRIPPPENPYTLDYRSYMGRRGIYLEGKAEEISVKPHRRNILHSFVQETRGWLTGRIERAFTYFPEEKELVETITLGKERVPGFLRESGVRSGTYHLLVISGLHIAFVLLFLKIIFIPFAQVNNKYPKLFPFLSLLFMWFYAALTGFRVPIVRAVLMLTFFNAGEILERNIDGMDSIMTAAVLMLLINPYSLFDASFQLSFIATAGIILFSRRFGLLGRNYLQGLVLSSFAAQLAVFPILLHHFGSFYPAGLLNNILFLPFTGLLVIVSLLFFLLPFLFEPLRYLLTLFLRGITASSQFTFVINSSASLWLILFFWGASFLVFYVPRDKKTTVSLSCIVSVSILLSAAVPHIKQPHNDRLYLLSLSRPSALFVSENNKPVLFLADHYKKSEVENVLVPLLQKERMGNTEGLFYTNLSYNHTGTFKSLQGKTEILKVYEHPDIREVFGFPYNSIYFYQSLPGLFHLLPENGRLYLSGLSVEVLGEEKGMLSYVLKKGKTSILFAPYIGDQLSEEIKGRRFSVACIYNISTTSKTRKKIEKLDYLYLILPQDYKKFAGLPSPHIKTFYLKEGALQMDFSRFPFRISHFYE
jgi:ComEC/Rec2-related protein